MDHFSLPRRLYYSYLGYAFWLVHQTSTRRLLGVRLRTWLILIPIALLIYGWAARWDGVWLGVVALFLLWMLVTYWRAGRAGYYRFVTAVEQALPEGELQALPANQRIEVLATGSFSVQQREENVLLQPARYWQVPLGDHVVMVKKAPQAFLYQFFTASMLQTIRRGWIIYGPTPQRALAITFLSTWGPEFDIGNRYFLIDTLDTQPKKARTIYLSFLDSASERAVWHNVVHAARRARA